MGVGGQQTRRGRSETQPERFRTQIDSTKDLWKFSRSRKLYHLNSTRKLYDEIVDEQSDLDSELSLSFLSPILLPASGTIWASNFVSRSKTVSSPRIAQNSAFFSFIYPLPMSLDLQLPPRPNRVAFLPLHARLSPRL